MEGPSPMQDSPSTGDAAVLHRLTSGDATLPQDARRADPRGPGAGQQAAATLATLLRRLRGVSHHWWLGLACVALAGLCWTAALAIGRQREAAVFDTAMARAQVGAAEADRYAGRIIGLSRMLHRLGERWHAQTAGGQDAAAAELAWAMRSLVESSRGLILAGSIILRDGTIRWSTETLPPGTHAAGRAYILSLEAPGSSLFVGDPIILRPSGRAVVPISSRLEDDAGGFLGVVAVMIPANAIARGLANIASRPGEYATIFARDGTVIARSEGMADLVGRQILPESVVARIAAEPLGEARRIGPVTRRDEIVAWHRVNGLDLIAVMGIDVEAALREAHAFRRTLTLGAGAVTLLLAAGLLVSVEESRRRAAREAARLDAAALAKLEAIHAGLPVGVFVLERRPGGAIRVVHQGGDRGLLADHGLFTAQRPIPAESAFFGDLARDGRALLEWQTPLPAGGWSTCRVFARQMLREADGTMRVCGIVLDATVEREVLARVAATERLSQLGEFALGLAHELKQPLQIITLAADRAQLRAGSLTGDEVSKVFDDIVDQALRASQVIENLRRFARGDAADAAPVALPLDAAVRTSLDLMRGALAEAGIEVETAIGDPAPVVLARRSALEQVLINLLVNARDALAGRPPALPRRIRVSARWEAASVLIEVADTGGGIAPEILPRLFQPFATTKDPDKGTGLGLSICHGLVAGMQGAITGANGPAGAVMTIRLPAAPGPGGDVAAI